MEIPSARANSLILACKDFGNRTVIVLITLDS
jgi:hypothetical protein